MKYILFIVALLSLVACKKESSEDPVMLKITYRVNARNPYRLEYNTFENYSWRFVSLDSVRGETVREYYIPTSQMFNNPKWLLSARDQSRGAKDSVFVSVALNDSVFASASGWSYAIVKSTQ